MIGPIVEPPVTVPSTQLADVGLAVKDPATRRSRHVGQLAATDGAEPCGKTLDCPSQFVSMPVTGIHYGNNGLAHGFQSCGLLVCQRHSQKGETIKELGVAVLDFLAAKGFSHSGETAFWTAAEGYAFVFVFQLFFQDFVAGNICAINAGEIDVVLLDAFLRQYFVEPEHFLVGRWNEEDAA